MSNEQNQQQVDANKDYFDKRFKAFEAQLEMLPDLVSDTDNDDYGFNWVKLELMGRKVIVGKLTEVLIAGAPMLRIDVPETEKEPAYTQFYGPSAIYCITPIAEDVARQIAPNINASPISH